MLVLFSTLVLTLAFVPTSSVWAANSGACGLIKKASTQDLLQWREDMNCRDLAVGEKRQVIKDWRSAPTRIPTNYVLTKLSDSQYQIDLPLNVHEKGFQGIKSRLGLSQSATETEMRNKIRGCAALHQNALRGPNGEQFILNPIVKKEDKTAWHIGVSSNISVEKTPNFRSNSENYAEDISCAAILHELLHLLGLVDEYQEQDSASPLFQGCRIGGPDSSIMSNHYHAIERFDQPLPSGLHYKTEVCMETAYGDKCHPYYVESDSNDPSPSHETLLRLMPSLTMFKGTFTQISKEENGQRVVFDTPIKDIKVRFIRSEKKTAKLLKGSVLEPAHFRAIVYPGCEKKNSLYYKCAQLAYKYPRPEKKIWNVTVRPEVKCDIPPECQTHDWLK